MTRPRVTASHIREAVSRQKLADFNPHVTPHVLVEVDFNLHDHDTAIAMLHSAVADVLAQIEETHG